MTDPRSHGVHPLELAAGVACGIGLLAAAGVWLTTSLATALSTGSWPDLRLANALVAATRWPHHLGDPASAWPVDAHLAGPFAMYSTALVLVGTLLGVVWIAVAVRGGGSRPDAARWARRRDLRPLLAREPRAGRVTLGRRGRRLVCCEPLHSALVIGPTQTGKTTGLAIPAILEWQGPVLATSVKSDLMRDTIDARAALDGRVQLFDPLGCTGEPSASWTPLADCGTWAGARRIANWLTEGAAANRKGMNDADFWYASAAKLLAPLLFAAATTNRAMADVVEWVDTQEIVAIEDALRRTRDRQAINAFDASINRDSRQRSSVYWTAETVLEAYADPDVLKHSRTAGIRADQVLDGRRNTLYLSATAREQRRLRPLFVALIESVVEAAYRKASTTGRPLDPPLLVVLDEAANIAPLPDLDVIASTGASHGVQLLTVLQDLAQAQDRWGRERADTIVNNHRARVIAGGAADERTLEYVARLLGDTEFRQHSSTTGEPGRHSTTTSSGYRPLAPANVVREAPTGSALLLYGNLRPAWIRFRPWYRERRGGKRRSALQRVARQLALRHARSLLSLASRRHSR